MRAIGLAMVLACGDGGGGPRDKNAGAIDDLYVPPGVDSGDTGDTGDTGETADTAETGDLPEWSEFKVAFAELFCALFLSCKGKGMSYEECVDLLVNDFLHPTCPEYDPAAGQECLDLLATGDCDVLYDGFPLSCMLILEDCAY